MGSTEERDVEKKYKVGPEGKCRGRADWGVTEKGQRTWTQVRNTKARGKFRRLWEREVKKSRESK